MENEVDQDKDHIITECRANENKATVMVLGQKTAVTCNCPANDIFGKEPIEFY